MRKATIAFGLAVMLGGCGDDGSGVPACCVGAASSAATIPDTSIHLLDHAWQDQTGRTVTLRDFGGQPVLLAMIFTHCQYACPAIVADLQRILAAVPAGTEAPRVVLASMDHERDTPAALTGFARMHGLAPERFTLLHGAAEAVADLAAVLGVRYARAANGDFSHSNLITLLDRRGVIAFRHEGLGADATGLLLAIREQASRD